MPAKTIAFAAGAVTIRRAVIARKIHADIEMTVCTTMTALMFELPREDIKEVRLEPRHLDAPLEVLPSTPTLRLEGLSKTA